MKLEPGWYNDPYFLDRERYWDGGWTDKVRLLEHEEPPIQTVRPVATTTPQRDERSVGSTPTSFENDTLVVPAPASPRPDDTLVVPAPASSRPDDTLVVPATPNARPDDTATIPATAPANVDTGVLPAISPDDASARKPAGPGPRRPPQRESSRAAAEEAAAARARGRRRRLAYVVVPLVLLVVAAIVAIVVSSGGGGANHPLTAVTAPPVGAAPQSAQPASAATATPTLEAAAHASVAKKSVVAAVAVVPTNSSQSDPQQISGTGAFVLNVGLGPLSVSSSDAPTKSQKLLFQGTTVYVNVAQAPVPGKTWVVAGTNNLPTIGSDYGLNNLVGTMGNPGLLLNQLVSTPISVSLRGTSSIGATTVHVYDVSFTSGSSATIAAGYGSHSSEEVDVGPDQTVRQIVMPGPDTSVNGQDVPQNVVVTFTHYGKPLVVATPPFSQLISLSQYLTAPAPATGQSSGNS